MSELFIGLVATNAAGLLVKTIMNQDFVKEFAQDLARDYAKDFFKDRFNNVPIAIFQKEPLEKAIVKALKEFFEIVEQELKFCRVSQDDIKRFAKPLKEFIYHKSVKEILGKAFADECDSLDYQQLEQLWKQQNYQSMPAKFNWRSVTDNYLRKCQLILFESEDLRDILIIQKVDTLIKQNQKRDGITPDFDLSGYREAIRERYGNLKLYRLETKGSEYKINLWQIFVAQNVRQVYQVLPELPKEHIRKLQATQQLDAEFDLERYSEILERYKSNYREQPIRLVLDVIKEKQYKNYLVILGDPGSGKSTLLHYLALDWVAQTFVQNTFDLPIPLLIELNSYVRDRNAGKCHNFLEFYHHSPNCFFHLNQHELDKRLKAGNALVMFDGLDEIFDLAMREEIITCIHSFTNKYPDVQVVVTSRIIGYKSQQLQDAEFRHFMLQDLESAQITDFLQRWHDRVFNEREDKERNFKQERLQKVIQESKSIAELAGNPLLLTMMAILNLNQELPRDRPELYNQASRILLHQWDVERALIEDERLDHKTIDYKDKQAVLRQVAYSMQTSDKGLAGNVISAIQLENILTDYLKSIDINQPRQAARLMINQLRTRNFMLCFLGADYYAFVHRTFLEYFCAWEFVWQFKEAQTLSIKELKQEVFGKHWQDESWHEVLRLIAGMIESKFTGEIIEYLIEQEGDLTRIYLAVDCLLEVRNRILIKEIDIKLFNQVKELTQLRGRKWVRQKALQELTKGWRQEPETLSWLKLVLQTDEHPVVLMASLEELGRNFKENPDVKTIIKNHALHDDPDVRATAIKVLAENFTNQLDLFDIYHNRVLNNPVKHDYSFGSNSRQIALEIIIKQFPQHPKTLPLLRDRAENDPDEQVREYAQKKLKQWEG